MEKLIGVLAVLTCVLTGCGDNFTAEPLFSQSGISDAGAAGQVAEAFAGSAGAPTEHAGASGVSEGGAAGGEALPSAGAGGSAVSTPGGAGGAPVVTPPPCQNAIDAPSHGYLALQGDTCYRTPDVFNTLTCGGTGWAARTIHVNGTLALCDATGVFPPQIDGYTYIEIDGGDPGADWLRWSESE